MQFTAHEWMLAVVLAEAGDRAVNTGGLTAFDNSGNGAGREMLILLNTGTFSTGSLDLKIQESDDNSTWNDITGAAFPQITSANDEKLYIGRIQIEHRKRYFRAHETLATAASDYGCVALVINHPIQPVTQLSTTAAISFNIKSEDTTP